MKKIEILVLSLVPISCSDRFCTGDNGWTPSWTEQSKIQLDYEPAVDEARRFAVTFHRLRRAKKSFESPLDSIPGIGLKRKASLLSKFKSLEAIGKATQEELAETIGQKAAKELKARLK